MVTTIGSSLTFTMAQSTRFSAVLGRLAIWTDCFQSHRISTIASRKVSAWSSWGLLEMADVFKKKIVMHCYKFIMYGGTSRFCLAINCCHVKYHGAKHYAPDFCKDGMGMIKKNDIALAFILHQYCIFLSHNTPQTLTLGHVSRRDPLKNRRWISRSLRKIKSNLFKHCLSSPFMNKNWAWVIRCFNDTAHDATESLHDQDNNTYVYAYIV